MSDTPSATILEQTGLTPNEAKIYETLLLLSEATVAVISKKANLHRRNVYDAINRLVAKGLVFENFEQKETLYSPVDPEKLLEVIKEKETNFLKILPNLRNLYEKVLFANQAYIYRGFEGFKNYTRDIVRVGQEVYTVGGLAWLDERAQVLLQNIFKEAEHRNIKFKAIFDHKVKAKESSIPILRRFRSRCKFYPKEYATASSVDAFGNYVGSYALDEEGQIDDDAFIFIIRDKNLADSCRQWFRFMWDSLPSS